MKRSTLAVIIVTIVALVGIGLAFTNRNPKQAINSNPPINNSAQIPASTTTTPEVTSATLITYSGSGFSPASITLNSGDSLTLKNASSSEVQLNSDPHPVHTDNSELNVGSVAAGKSATFTLNKKGNFGYHNHLNSSETGRVTVK